MGFGPSMIVMVALLAASAAFANGKVVFLIRHCVRSIDVSAITAYNNTPFPQFHVPYDYCLPRGLSILEGIGGQLVQDWAVDINHLEIIADDLPRNIDSMAALARGLGLAPNATNLHTNSAPFGHCSFPASNVQQSLIEQQLKETPLPINASGMVAMIDSALGGGASGNRSITEQADKVEGDALVGVHSLAAKMSEIALMQYGGGMEVAWGRLGGAGVDRVNQMQVFLWQVTKRVLKLEQAESSKMLAAVLEALKPDGGGVGGANNGTTIFVGRKWTPGLQHAKLTLTRPSLSSEPLGGRPLWLFCRRFGCKRCRHTPRHELASAPVCRQLHCPQHGAAVETLQHGGVGSPGVKVDFVYPTFDDANGTLHTSPVWRGSVQEFCKKAATLDQKCAGGGTPAGSLCK